MAQIALAWLLGKNIVGSPIVGTTSIGDLKGAVEAVEPYLDDSDWPGSKNRANQRKYRATNDSTARAE